MSCGCGGVEAVFFWGLIVVEFFGGWPHTLSLHCGHTAICCRCDDDAMFLDRPTQRHQQQQSLTLHQVGKLRLDEQGFDRKSFFFPRGFGAFKSEAKRASLTAQATVVHVREEKYAFRQLSNIFHLLHKSHLFVEVEWKQTCVNSHVLLHYKPPIVVYFFLPAMESYNYRELDFSPAKRLDQEELGSNGNWP